MKIWSFKGQWHDERQIADNFCGNIMAAYEQLETNPHFLKIIGMTLYIGNILNGGTPKGQADGFDLPTLGKVGVVKDNNGNSML